MSTCVHAKWRCMPTTAPSAHMRAKASGDWSGIRAQCTRCVKPCNARFVGVHSWKAEDWACIHVACTRMDFNVITVVVGFMTNGYVNLYIMEKVWNEIIKHCLFLQHWPSTKLRWRCSCCCRTTWLSKWQRSRMIWWRRNRYVGGCICTLLQIWFMYISN